MSNTILSKKGYLIPKNNENIKLINSLKKELTVEPFQILKFIKKKKKFEVYQEDDEFLYIPKYYGLKFVGKPTKNEENIGLPINITFKSKLRENQLEIIDKVLSYINTKDGGLLSLPCGFGKTVIALYISTILKVKTIVIVHKEFLLNQWKERCEEFTNAKVGIIQRNIVDIENKDIVFAMLQSIAKDKYESLIFKDFGFVIFDEAHHAPSEYFSKALPIIASKKTLALSATPKRDDRLEKILNWYFGELIHKIENKENNKVLVNIYNYDLVNHPKFKEYFLKSGDVNRPETINNIISIGRRNKFIIDLLEEIITNKERKILILSDRIEHLNLLKDRLDNRNITTADYYIGGMKQKDLKNAELAQVIFASYTMASEALDIPDLNTLFMVTSRSKVEQSIGRIIRKININIRPMVFDFTDQLPVFKNQGYQRKKLYRKMGFEIKIYNVINNEIKIENNKNNNDNDNDNNNDNVNNNDNDNEDNINHNNKCDFID